MRFESYIFEHAYRIGSEEFLRTNTSEFYFFVFDKMTLSNIWKTSRSALSNLKHEAIVECFRSDKAHTANFFSDLRNKPPNMLICFESLEINVFYAAKIWGKSKRVLSH